MMPYTHTRTASRDASFRSRVVAFDPQAVGGADIDELMVNVGLRCNMACAHCHHSCSPTRTEVMPAETVADALALARALGVSLVDVTGGEPTLYPGIRELVVAAREAALPLRVRTNLVALTLPETAGLPTFLAENHVAILASLPGVSAGEVEAQRGAGAWKRSIAALRELATLGYGSGGAPGALELAYNPPLGALAESDCDLDARFREALEPLGVRFDRVLAIANVSVGRFGALLRDGDAAEEYAALLADAFNPRVIAQLACRRSLEVAWDGSLWDCDFNLGARVRPAAGPRTVSDALAAPERVSARLIGFGPHCFACTAGAGSG